MILSDAAVGYFLELSSGNYSDCTIKLYRSVLTEICKYFKDPDVESITSKQLQDYMAYMRHEYKPQRKGVEHLSGSSLDNRWKGIRSFFKWAEKRLDVGRPDKQLTRPKYPDAEIDPYSEDEVRKIFDACEYSREFTRWNTKPYRLKRHTHLRDHAILSVLLDTGLRVGEVARLEIQDVDIQTGEVDIMPWSTQRKTKGNTVVIGKGTRRAIWLYLNRRRRNSDPDDSLFEISSGGVQQMLTEIEKRTGIKPVNPHRFRHTFAIEFLRNGGNVFELQKILGHTTLEMCRRYAKIAKQDIVNSHRKASPVDRWKL